jgi:hypothetical protein
MDQEELGKQALLFAGQAKQAVEAGIVVRRGLDDEGKAPRDFVHSASISGLGVTSWSRRNAADRRPCRAASDFGAASVGSASEESAPSP